MNLFWKKVFGGLTSTEKLEKEEEALLLAYKRYCDIETSEQLAEYTRLFHLVKAADFKEKKKTLQNRKFKDTEEYRDFRKYEKLHNSANIKLYYQVLDSSQLKEFLAFKETKDYEKLGNPKLVKADATLQKFKAYEKGKPYKNYIRFHKSFVISEYEKLKELVAKPEFIQSKAYWEDNNRWLKTEEYKIEQRYYELQKTPDIAFYEATDPKKFKVLDEWTLTFQDDFTGSSLDAKWKNGYYHRAEALKKIYSFANEKQANTDGKNITVASSHLAIKTLPEKKEALAWDVKNGFVKKSFDFTSGIVNTGEAFQQKNGLIKAKLRTKGSADVSHAFWLGTDGKLPHINVFYFDGKTISVNNYAKDGTSVSISKETVKGISPADFYIYSLEWTPTELVWKINNVEIYRVNKSIPQQSMFPVFNSFISEKQKGGSGTLEVDWIKVYTKK
jgi:beta-glucanase (GH16 family)